MDEETQFGEGKARLLEERDVPSILEALFTEEFYRKYPEHMRKHLTRVAEKGLDRYSNILVVERDGKAVCRAVIDTPYPPYAEVGVDSVHPEYTGNEEQIWTELIEGSISLAKQFNCNIIYAMEFKNSPSARPFYQKYGAPAYRVYSKFDFQPTMLQGFTDNEEEICLFRFFDAPCYQGFMHRHPLSVMSISGGKTDFQGNRVYKMKWDDPQTNDFLAFYLKGKRHESMPRIVGIAGKEGSSGFDAWTEETTPDITSEKSGKFRICLENTGEQKLRTQISFLLPRRTTIDDQAKKTISTELEKEARWELKFEVKPDFEVPPLSFWTILVTCQLQIDKFPSTFPISAGFELDRPPMKRKK